MSYIEKNVTKQRESGLELFRIITMLLIVAHHYVVNSGLLGETMNSPITGKSLFLLLFGAWGKMGINCFVLITGYFMCKSNITLKKFLKLVLEIIFYRVVFYFMFLLMGDISFSFTSVIKLVLPVTNVSDNFTGCYIAFFLCIPFINILIKNITEKQHIYLIILVSYIYIVLGTVPWFGVKMNYVSWFIVLYFVASYIRLYSRKIFDSVKLWLGISFCLLVVSLASIIVCVWLGNKTGQFMPYYFLSDSNKILAVITALALFLFFKNVKFQNRFINTVASSCFGVLLIHANSDAMRNWLWKEVLNNVEMYNSKWLVLHAITSVIAIYVICTAIDSFRIRYIEKPFFNFLNPYINKTIERYKNVEQRICKKLSIKED